MQISIIFNRSADGRRKRSGGRPKKSPDKKRKRYVTSVYTDAEFLSVTSRAKEARTGLSVYQRQSALQGKVTAVNSDAGLRIAILREILTQTRHCRAELHKIERSCARTDRKPEAQAAREQLKDVDSVMALLITLLRKEARLDSH